MNNNDHNLRFWLTKSFDILPNPLRFYRNLKDFQNFPQNLWDFVSKYGALMFFFFKFVMKNFLLWCTWLVKKCKFCQNYTLLWAKKVNRMPFFSDFSRKNYCSYVNFFKIFIKNPLLSCPYLIKNVNSIKTTLYYEPKKSIGCPFFPISHGKTIALMPIFCKKKRLIL